MGSARAGDTRECAGELRALAAAEEDAAQARNFRASRARRLQRREGLFPKLSRILCGGEFVSTIGQRERTVPGSFESARALVEWTAGRHKGGKHRGAVHQFRA